jgi:hypothetical protein
MLLAFCAGFFGLLSLLQGEDLRASVTQSQSVALDVISQLFDGLTGVFLLLFLYLRILQLMKDDRLECESIAIGYFASEKDIFGVAIKCAVFQALNS